MTQEELDAYDYAFMREADERGRLAKAVQKAVQQEVQKALEKEIELILEMVKEGLSFAQIGKVTQKTEEEIHQIIAKQR